MERIKEVVLDASIVVKWFSDEKATDSAVKVRDDHIAGRLTVVSPDLMIYEVSNALRYSPALDAKDVEDATNSILDLQLDIVPPNEEMLRRAIIHAFKQGITVYDACYLALAEFMGIEFITADEKLYEKIKDLSFVKLLESF